MVCHKATGREVFVRNFDNRMRVDNKRKQLKHLVGLNIARNYECVSAHFHRTLYQSSMFCVLPFLVARVESLPTLRGLDLLALEEYSERREFYIQVQIPRSKLDWNSSALSGP